MHRLSKPRSAWAINTSKRHILRMDGSYQKISRLLLRRRLEVSMVPSDTMIYEFLIIYIINSFKSMLCKIKIPSSPKCLSLYCCFDLFCVFVQSKK